MTTSFERIRANAWGPYYVTGECDACGVCAVEAPDNVARSWDGTYYAVAVQPSNQREDRQMRFALAACPLRCIHDDGEA